MNQRTTDTGPSKWLTVWLKGILPLVLVAGCQDNLAWVKDSGSFKLRLAPAKDVANHRTLPGSYIIESKVPVTASASAAPRAVPLWLAAYDPTLLVSIPIAETKSLHQIWRVDFDSAAEAVAVLRLFDQEDDFVLAEPNWFSAAQSKRPLSTLDSLVAVGGSSGNSGKAAPKTQPQSAASGNHYLTLASSYTEDMPNAFWLQQIRLPEAFSALAGLNLTAPKPENRPIIAVLDSGVDVLHPALAGQIYDVPDHLDQCGSGTDGCDTTSGSGRFGMAGAFPVGTQGADEFCEGGLSQVCPHGTLIAGIIAATPQVGYGGICPDCQILPIKVVSNGGRHGGAILDSSIIRALGYLLYLKENGVPIRIVNASFGKFRRSRTVSLLIQRLARGGAGTLIIAAAGNENTAKPQYPAALDDVMAVANIDSLSAQRHPTSNYGDWVALAAPGAGPCLQGRGNGILSATPGGGTQCAAGTSFSAPVVAGVAGLLLANEPALTAQELRERLLASANPRIYRMFDNDAYTDKLGRGVVDALAAVSGLQVSGAGASKPQRIAPGCGSVAGVAAVGPAQSWGALWLLWLPLVVGLVRPYQRRLSAVVAALGGRLPGRRCGGKDRQDQSGPGLASWLLLGCAVALLSWVVAAMPVYGASPNASDAGNQQLPPSPWHYQVETGWLMEYQQAFQPGPAAGMVMEESFTEHSQTNSGRIGYLYKVAGGEVFANYNGTINFVGPKQSFADHLDRPFAADSPFHPKNSERQHQLALVATWQWASWGLQLRSSYAAEHIGSDWFPGEAESARPARTVNETLLLNPELRYRFGAAHEYETRLGTNHRKRYSYESSEMTYQSYGAGIGGLSWYGEQRAYVAAIKSDLRLRYFHNQHVFQASAKDFQRRGFMIMLSHRYGDFGFKGLYSGFVDAYKEDLIAAGSCRYAAADIYDRPVACQREDEGMFYRLAVAYHLNDRHGFELMADTQTLTNSDFPQYEAAKRHIMLVYTFGSSQDLFARVEPYEDRLGTFGFDARVDSSR